MDKVTKEFLNLGWELKPEQRRELDKLVHIVRKQTLSEVLKDIIETKKAWKQIKRKKPLYETAKHMILLLENWQHVYELKLKEVSEPSGSDLEQKLKDVKK